MLAYMFQITIDGIWENATQFDISTSSENEIGKLEAFFALNNSEDIAFEVFFKNTDDEINFFGMRISELVYEEKRQKVREILEFLFDVKQYDKIISKISDTFKTKLTDKNPDFKEVGFEGFWKSRGSVVVQSQEKTLDYDQLITQYSQFDNKYDDRFIMMEYAWIKSKNIKHAYWIAKQLSKDFGKIDPLIYNKFIGE